MVVESSAPRSAVYAAGLLRLPGLFVRLSSSKIGPSSSNGVDLDSVWSPTSPLDLKSNTNNPTPRVGLGLVDALIPAGSLLKASFLDSVRPFLDLGLPAKPTPALEKDSDSEEYTCVIARGANPRTTHILGGDTLEVRAPAAAGGRGRVVFTVEPFTDLSSAAPTANGGVASGRCRCCMRRLPENRDIFMYKGEKAFCSSECREGYIEEEVDDLATTALDHGGSSTAFFLGEDW